MMHSGAPLGAALPPETCTPEADVDALLRSVSFAVNLSKVPPAPEADACRAVLLTGATGLLGSEVLCGLLEQSFKSQSSLLGYGNSPTKLTVFCLVRSTSEEFALQRIRLAVEETGRKWPVARSSAQIVPVLGDLTLPRLGLEDRQYDELAKSIEAVYHMGGLCDHTGPYSAYAGESAVLGSIIDFCIYQNQKRLHYASSLAIFPWESSVPAPGPMADFNENSLLTAEELSVFKQPHEPGGGLMWSKWVSETVLRGMRARGLPVNVYRFPRMVCSSRVRSAPRGDAVWWQLYAASVNAGCFPVNPVPFSFSPVNICARILVELSVKALAVHWVYHVLDTKCVCGDQLTRWASQTGFEWKPVAWTVFRRSVLSWVEKRQSVSRPPGQSGEELQPETPGNPTQLRISGFRSSALEDDIDDEQQNIRATAIKLCPVDTSLQALRKAAEFAFELFSPFHGEGSSSITLRHSETMPLAPHSVFRIPYSTLHVRQDLFLPGSTNSEIFVSPTASTGEFSPSAGASPPSDWESVLESCWPSSRDFFLAGLRSIMLERIFAANSATASSLLDEATIRAEMQATADKLQGVENEEFDGLLLSGFRLLIEEVASSANSKTISFIAKVSLARILRSFARTSVWMNGMSLQNPTIEELPINQPVFILGIDFTSMRFLQQILARDPECRVPKIYELLTPYGEDGNYCPQGLPARAVLETDPRIPACRENLSQLLGRLADENGASSSSASETCAADFIDDSILLDHCGRGMILPKLFNLERRMRQVSDADSEELEKAYAYHRKCLRHLTFQKVTGRWILCSPFHLLNPEVLNKMYPNAQFVFLHRDPVFALANWCSSEVTRQEQLLELVNDSAIGATMHEMVRRLLCNLVTLRLQMSQAKDSKGNSRTVDLYASQLASNPVHVVKKVYKAFGWHMSAEVEGRMRKDVDRKRCGQQPPASGNTTVAEKKLLRCGMTSGEVAGPFLEYCKMVRIRGMASGGGGGGYFFSSKKKEGEENIENQQTMEAMTTTSAKSSPGGQRSDTTPIERTSTSSDRPRRKRKSPKNSASAVS